MQIFCVSLLIHSSNNDTSECCNEISPERRDILTYRYPSDLSKCFTDSSDVFYNLEMRKHIATKRMNEHDWKHRHSCFKYGGECRYCFPFKCSSETQVVFEDGDLLKETDWLYVDGTARKVYPYSICPKRTMGSQYLNTHSSTITDLLGCNSNIQIGSPRCVFYVVHYSTKNTQKEDKGPDFERIGQQVITRLQREQLRIQQEADQVVNSESTSSESEDCFREGLSRFLLGMGVHLSQDVVSATMAHLLICQKGSRFTFSHDFKDLLLGQLLNKLEGREPGDFVLRKRSKGTNGEADIWPDFSINDYLYRPVHCEYLCFYEYIERYEKSFLSWQRMAKLDEDGLPELKKDELRFEIGHPGRRYCVVKKSSVLKVPIISMPRNQICNLVDLDFDKELIGESISDTAVDNREKYAKAALALFVPLRDSEIFDLTDQFPTLWDKFKFYYNSNDNDKFSPLGKQVLQNIQDSLQGRKCSLPGDEIKDNTTITIEEEKCKTEYFDEDSDDFGDASSVNTFDENEAGEDFSFESEDFSNRKLVYLKKGMKIEKQHILHKNNQDMKSIFDLDSKSRYVICI
jgi:hypothetical protein